MKKQLGLMAMLVCLTLAACTQTSPAEPPLPTDTPAAAESTSYLLLDVSFQDLVTQAQWILVGTVGAMQSAWNDEHTNILTTIAITPERWIKGESSANPLILCIPGGTVGDITEASTDDPSFQEGERVVLFLREHLGAYEIVGAALGKFTVNDDEERLNNLIQNIQMILESNEQGALEEETPEALEPLSSMVTIEPPEDLLTVEPFPGTATIEPPPATATVEPLLDATPLDPEGGLVPIEAPEPGFHFLFLPIVTTP